MTAVTTASVTNSSGYSMICRKEMPPSASSDGRVGRKAQRRNRMSARITIRAPNRRLLQSASSSSRTVTRLRRRIGM